MKLDKKDLSLYLVTDRRWLNESTLSEVVEIAVKNGVTFVQLREKDLDYESFKTLAKSIKEVTDKYEIPFVINDEVVIAKEIETDGVHIGQGDMSAREVREIIGSDKILGVSVGSVEEAIKAENDGADYLGVGTIFQTKSKLDAISVGLNELKNIKKSVNIPVIGIGGIEEDNIHILKGIGIDGVAVISAILDKEDIGKSTRDLRSLVDKYIGGIM